MGLKQALERIHVSNHSVKLNSLGGAAESGTTAAGGWGEVRDQTAERFDATGGGADHDDVVGHAGFRTIT